MFDFFHFRHEVVYPTDQGTQVNDKLHFEISNVLSVQNKTMTTISKERRLISREIRRDYFDLRRNPTDYKSILGTLYHWHPHYLKITQNVAFEFFEFWHFPSIFVLLKVTR